MRPRRQVSRSSWWLEHNQGHSPSYFSRLVPILPLGWHPFREYHVVAFGFVKQAHPVCFRWRASKRAERLCPIASRVNPSSPTPGYRADVAGRAACWRTRCVTRNA